MESNAKQKEIVKFEEYNESDTHRMNVVHSIPELEVH